jgi:hypothetical protein
MSDTLLYSLFSVSSVIAVLVIIFVVITLCLNWIECCVKRNYMQIPYGSYVIIKEKGDENEIEPENIIKRPITQRGERINITENYENETKIRDVENVSPFFIKTDETQIENIQQTKPDEQIVEYECSDSSPNSSPNSSPYTTPESKDKSNIQLIVDDDNDNKPISTSTIIVNNNQEPAIEFNIKMNTDILE